MLGEECVDGGVEVTGAVGVGGWVGGLGREGECRWVGGWRRR